MSVTIRLAKIGKKFAPAYKIVAATTKSKRNGRFLEILGSFNPFSKKDSLVFDKDALEAWTKKGAKLTPATEKVIEGKFEYKEYNPKKQKKLAELAKASAEKAASQASEEPAEETSVEETQVEQA